jgi:glycine/D-amino acid oxidase-like deaminating enzyme
METFDWIVVGAGITGSALGYELTKAGFRVLLLDREFDASNATRQSYGGIAHWAGTTPLTTSLCEEGIAIHRQLSEELGADTEFCNLDLLLTVTPEQDLAAVLKSYRGFVRSPIVLSAMEACDLEPLLDHRGIQGALWFPHGHVNAVAMANAYRNRMVNLGGVYQRADVQRTLPQQVVTNLGDFVAPRIALCAGSETRSLMQMHSIAPHFSHAESIETLPVDFKLRSLVMPAVTERFVLEAEAGKTAFDPLWEGAGNEPVAPILDAGAIQFWDGRIRMGQITRVKTGLNDRANARESERELRQAIALILPKLANLPGQWQSCTVAFSRDHLPIVGFAADREDLYIFSGFSNPMVFVPALARRVAKMFSTGIEDDLLTQLSPRRFL